MGRSKRKILNYPVYVMLVVILTFVLGCEEEDTGGSFRAAAVALQSGTFSAKLRAEKVGALAVSNFSFCVTQLKFEAEGGADVETGGSAFFEARIGLVDAGSGSVIVDWGTADFPAGATIKKIKVEVHHDPETCGGANYSVSLNGSTIQQDVEMVFTLPTADALLDGDVISLDLSQIAAAFSTAYDAGDFNDSNITTYIQNLQEGSVDSIQ